MLPPLRLKQPVQHLLESAVHYPAKTPSAHQSRSLFDLYIEPVDYSTDSVRVGESKLVTTEVFVPSAATTADYTITYSQGGPFTGTVDVS